MVQRARVGMELLHSPAGPPQTREMPGNTRDPVRVELGRRNGVGRSRADVGVDLESVDVCGLVMVDGAAVFVEYDSATLLCWLCGRSKELWGQSPPPTALVCFRHRVVGLAKGAMELGSGATSSVN